MVVLAGRAPRMLPEPGAGGSRGYLKWRSRISEVSECLSLAALSPEDRDGVAVDLGQEIVDVRGWFELVVAVEAEVAVAPVQRPRLGRLGVADPGDGEPCPFRADALAPGRPAL